VETLKPVQVRWWLVAPLLALAMFVAPMPAWIVETFYARDLYPWLQRVLTWISNLVPVAVIDLMFAGVIIAVGVRVARLIGVLRQHGWLTSLWEAVRRLVRALAVAVIVFLLAWGCNYRRVPIDTTLPQPVAAPTLATLQGAVADAAALAAQLRPVAVASPALEFPELARVLEQPMNAALLQLNRKPLVPVGRPKVSYVLTPFFTAAAVTGMVNPYALESIVHPDLLPVERPFVLAHEWAHLSGHADEAEASAVGWLACMKGGPQLAYSASVYLLMEASSELPSDERKRVMERLDPAVLADIRAVYARAMRYQPQVQRAATRVYDEYLRANRVADGTRSYGRALTLILSPSFNESLTAYRTTGSPPR